MLYGGAGDDTLIAGEPVGQNMLYGEDGNDDLKGASGSDILVGGAGDDVISGEAGNDFLYGGVEVYSYNGNYYASNAANGNDTYKFGIGFGKDIVLDRDRTEGNVDTILLSGDLLPDQINLMRSINNGTDDLVLGIVGSTDTLTVKNWFKDGSKEWRVEQIQFGEVG